MVKGVGVPSMQKQIRQFWVVGRAKPTESAPEPVLYRIRVFAKNPVLARSRFWYQMKRQNKIRSTHGEVVQVSEITERNTNSIKNYGVMFKYASRVGIINMYKEFRDVTLCGAISQMYTEMAGRHSGRSETIHIIKTTVVPNSKCVRANMQQLNKTSLRFPKITTVKRAPTAAHASVFTASRPTKI
jgi:large subunit ribosomal protein L18Ae